MTNIKTQIDTLLQEISDYSRKINDISSQFINDRYFASTQDLQNAFDVKN